MFKSIGFIGLVLATCSACAASPNATPDSPKLIVQITIDQLRTDLLSRYQQHYLSGSDAGFNRFLNQGLTYNNAHYRHATTLTAVGHATLATGALPSQHGIIANDWFDPASNQSMYCVADANSKILDGKGGSASPVNLTAPTFSDQLHWSSGGKAKIYGVSIKDRGAVLTAGHFGKAVWLDKKTGNFVTSDYYYDAMPKWLREFNQSNKKDAYLGASWDLLHDRDVYLNSEANRPFQVPPRGFNPGFPHGMPDQPGKPYYGLLGYTPFGDELTAELAKHIVSNQDLGQDEITDYLSISFSVNDYVGHMFGPYSLEAEDNLVRLDRTLADFFRFLDKRIGLENVLFALSSDHGVDAIPEYKRSLGLTAARLKPEADLQSAVDKLNQHYGVAGSLVTHIGVPNTYLNHALIQQAGLNADEVATRLASLTAPTKGVALAITGKQLMARDYSQDPVLGKMQRNYQIGRSGDVILVQAPSTNVGTYSAATHGSPYRYDTHVPLHFSGWKVTKQRVARQVSPEDLALSLSMLLGIAQPAKATGQPLIELIRVKR